ncbi:MAG TPA: hypothetical protein VK081_12150 [Planctomycetota bacterium]|nr:hypothetical protein [Planctomycetota bacterium]
MSAGTRSGTALAFLGGLLAGCSYVEHDHGWAVRPARIAAAHAFPSSTRVHGVDPPAPPQRIPEGDCILYGIEFEKGDVRRDWLVHVEVEDAEFEPRANRFGDRHASLRLAVRVTDETGAEVGRDVVTVSREDLLAGLVDACRGESHVVRGSTRLRADVAAVLALRNMLAVMRESEVLSDILWTVIDKPSLFSVIRNFGVRVSLGADFEGAREAARMLLGGDPPAGRVVPVHEVPVELQLNGVPALRAKVLATEPDSPLNLGAGIVGIDAFQPSDPAARVCIRVLAARRAGARG